MGNVRLARDYRIDIENNFLRLKNDLTLNSINVNSNSIIHIDSRLTYFIKTSINLNSNLTYLIQT